MYHYFSQDDDEIAKETKHIRNNLLMVLVPLSESGEGGVKLNRKALCGLTKGIVSNIPAAV